MTDNSKLVEEYRAACANYARSLKEFQCASARIDHNRLGTLVLSVETARLNYSTARDRLSAQMMGVDVAPLHPAAAEYRIRDTAQLLWELSGKPQGTAEFDWLRAERIVRHTSTPTAVEAY